MKRALVMILAVCMILGFAAANAETYELDSYEFADELGSGYTYTATLKVGPWVKAADTEAVNAAWEAIDGEGDAPQAEDFQWWTGSGDPYSTKTSIMCFGTVYFKDTTPGDFQISDADSSQIQPEIYMNTDSWSILRHNSDSAIYASNGAVHRGSFETILEVRPSFKGRTWGPTPFVICVEDALTPEYPNGDPDIFETDWWWPGEGDIYIKPSWE